TPRVAQALAAGLGKSTQELLAMARAGELVVQDFVPALTSQMALLRAEVESMPTTVEDAFQRLSNEMLAFVGIANQGLGATQLLVKGMESLAGNLVEVASLALAAG